MRFDISRDFLDGILLQHPPTREGKSEVRANGQLRFLPSSPDRTMHTAVVTFSLSTEGVEQSFARGGWRFLFTSDAAFDPQTDPENPFFASMMLVGMGKIMAQLNNLCMHANLPLVPFEASRLVRAAQGDRKGQPPVEGLVNPSVP